MAEGEQEDTSDCETPASTAAEPAVDSINSNKRGRGSKYSDAKKSYAKRPEQGNGSHDSNASNNDSHTNNNVHKGVLAHPRIKAVIIISVFSVGLSLAGFVASLRVSDSPIGVVASVLECVVAVGIFCVGLYGTLKEDPSFLALYSIFGICMALAQTLWVVLGSYSIYQLNASLRATKDEEEIAAIKGLLRCVNVYVAAAALSIVGYALAAVFARQLKIHYQQNIDTPNMPNRENSRHQQTKQSEKESCRHATVAVASPFA